MRGDGDGGGSYNFVLTYKKHFNTDSHRLFKIFTELKKQITLHFG